ncbi:hypothetical protein ACH4K8_34975 [Streptomyces anulatus]
MLGGIFLLTGEEILLVDQNGCDWPRLPVILLRVSIVNTFDRVLLFVRLLGFGRSLSAEEILHR